MTLSPSFITQGDGVDTLLLIVQSYSCELHLTAQSVISRIYGYIMQDTEEKYSSGAEQRHMCISSHSPLLTPFMR